MDDAKAGIEDVRRAIEGISADLKWWTLVTVLAVIGAAIVATIVAVSI
jgi:hypothetical protein